MTQLLTNAKRLLASVSSLERGALAIEHALMAGVGGGGIAVMSLELSETIERGLHTVLNAMS